MDNFRDSYLQVDWDLTSKRLRGAYWGAYWGKQYDTGRGFVVTVINGGQVVAPTTEVLRLKWEKPDKTTGYINATIVNGKFVVENIDQMFTVHGSVRADFELSVGGEFVASITFYVSVEKAVAVDAIESSSDFTALQEAIATTDGIDAQLAHKANDSEVRKRSVPIGLNDVTSELLTSIQNKEGETTFNLLSIPREKSVRFESLHESLANTESTHNLANDENTLLGGYFKADGSWFPTSTWRSSELVRVQPGKTYSYLGTGTHVTFWSESEEFIVGINTQTPTFTVPDNESIYYVRFWVYYAEGAMLVEGSTIPTVYVPFSQHITFKNITHNHPLLTGVDKEVKIFDGYYRNYLTGKLAKGDPNNPSSYSELTAVAEGSVYKTKKLGNVVFYDVDENYLSGKDTASIDGEYYVKIPKNAFYVGFTIRTINKESFEWTRVYGDAGTFSISQKRLVDFEMPFVKKIDFKNGDNLFDPRNIVKGFHYDYKGVFTENIGVNSSGFIKVNAGVTLEKNVAGHVSVYDKDFKFIDGWVMNDVPVQISLNRENIEYVNLSFSATKVTPEEIKLSYVDGDLDLYEPTDKLILKENLNEENGSLFKNITHPLLTGVDKEVKIFDGYFRSFDTGKLVLSETNCYSELIPVVEGSIYRAKNIGNVVYFDDDENYLSGMSFTNLEEERHIHIPKNSFYASFTSRKVNKPNIEWTRVSGSEGTFSISQKRLVDFEMPFVKKIDFKNGDELFNPKNVVKGFYYDYKGVPRESIGLNSTGFIKVNAGVTLEKNVPGHVSVYDKNFKYITGWIMENVPVQITLNHEDIEYINLSFSATKVIPEDVKLLYIAGDLDLYEPTDKLILKENQNEEIKENVSSLSMANSKDFLRIPTPYTDGKTDVWSKNQATHPSTVQFGDNWNGYKYWMAYTPYPYQRDQLENPCIAASNDGLNWVTPDGIVNPLDTPNGIGYNSDTHLLYRSDLNQLEVWYRGVKPNKSGEIIKRVVIDSDLNVSAPEDIIETSAADFDNSVLRYISPSVIFEDGKYKMWMMREWVVHYTESSDLLAWSNPVKIKSIGEDVMTWHPNMVKRDNVYYLFNTYNNNTLGKGGEIRYSTSPDGINFTKEKTIIKHRLNQFKLDGRGVYRATPLWLRDGSVGVIYGMVGYNGVWTLGMSVGEDFYNLEGIDNNTLAYMG